MTPEEFRSIYPAMIGWISSTLQAHAKIAQPIVSRGFSRLPLYFSPDLIASTKFVLADRLPVPPLSTMGLAQFAEFERGDFDGITYFDTFFVKTHQVANERLFFHELVHVVQWRLLGPKSFLAAYADGLERFGYRNSPLERMAYDAEAEFAASPTAYDAEARVARELN